MKNKDLWFQISVIILLLAILIFTILCFVSWLKLGIKF